MFYHSNGKVTTINSNLVLDFTAQVGESMCVYLSRLFKGLSPGAHQIAGLRTGLFLWCTKITLLHTV